MDFLGRMKKPGGEIALPATERMAVLIRGPPVIDIICRGKKFEHGDVHQRKASNGRVK